MATRGCERGSTAPPSDLHRSGVGALKSCEDAQQARLADAARPEHGDDLARRAATGRTPVSTGCAAPDSAARPPFARLQRRRHAHARSWTAWAASAALSCTRLGVMSGMKAASRRRRATPCSGPAQIGRVRPAPAASSDDGSRDDLGELDTEPEQRRRPVRETCRRAARSSSSRFMFAEVVRRLRDFGPCMHPRAALASRVRLQGTSREADRHAALQAQESRGARAAASCAALAVRR